MPGPLESILSHLLCCTARVKDQDGFKSFGGLGVFPFSAGKPTVFQDISSNSKRLGLGLSRDGLTAALCDEQSLFTFRVSVSAQVEDDEISFVSRFRVKGDTLLPFVTAVERFGADPPRFMAFSQNRAYTTSAEGDETTFTEIPKEYGSISCTTSFPWRQPGQPVCVTGTDGGYILLWLNGGILPTPIKSQSGGICSLSADQYHIYAGIKGTKKIEVFSVNGGSLVDTVEISSELFGNVGQFMLRPLARVVDRRPSSPHQSPKTAKPVGSLFVVNDKATMLAHINLELKQSVVEPAHSIPITQLLFGPFDNGPVISASAGNELVAWESGAFLRMSSRTQTPLIVAAVSPSRERPRLWVVCRTSDGHIELTPFGLRDKDSVLKENRSGCI